MNIFDEAAISSAASALGGLLGTQLGDQQAYIEQMQRNQAAQIQRAREAEAQRDMHMKTYEENRKRSQQTGDIIDVEARLVTEPLQLTNK